MNTKIIALVATLFVATLFVATSAQATIYAPTHTQTWPTVSLTAQEIETQAKALRIPEYAAAFNQEKNFQQNIQLAVLAGSGVVVATFLGCVFAEWLQEFKVRKAEKAKLIARLQCEVREVRATCYTA